MISPQAIKKAYTRGAESYDAMRFKSKAGEYRFKVERYAKIGCFPSELYIHRKSKALLQRRTYIRI